VHLYTTAAAAAALLVIVAAVQSLNISAPLERFFVISGVGSGTTNGSS